MTSLMSLHIKYEKMRWWSLKKRKCVPEAFSITRRTRRWPSETHSTAAAHKKHSNAAVPQWLLVSTPFPLQSGTCCLKLSPMHYLPVWLHTSEPWVDWEGEKEGEREREREGTIHFQGYRSPCHTLPHAAAAAGRWCWCREMFGVRSLCVERCTRFQVIIPFWLSTQPKTIRILSAMPGETYCIRSY